MIRLMTPDPHAQPPAVLCWAIKHDVINSMEGFKKTHLQLGEAAFMLPLIA